ncbi:hypothetical protein P8935_16965 [Telmatobacter sp. DSM 110680]|uniref:Uncharacterized protein n=1 Tax=Telmatobacter sp. DSM 110680 TaxID=3036704 RepID=A0AAU7DFY9_9BACT
MASSRVSYLWNDLKAPQGFRTAVSLHSHTNESRETLSSLAKFGSQYALMRHLMAKLERRSEANHGMRANYKAAYWTPPLTPKRAFDLESQQIEKLDLAAMVSLTDHDNIRAPQILQSAAEAPSLPVSVEWTAPYGDQSFHLGIHNLPAASASIWMEVLASYTINPSEERLKEILVALDAEPEVLVVFNHPMWDLYLVGTRTHNFLVNEFIHKYGPWIHALELNGLRHWDENRAVRQLSEQWDILLISGGDRHGLEPNANLNLTNATSFSEFVHEIRVEKKSDILFMPQYAEPWKHRMLRSAVDAIRDYPDFPQGSRRWDQRVFHPDADGVVRPLSDLWPDGTAPAAMTCGIGVVRMMGKGVVSQLFRMAWSESHELREALGEFNAPAPVTTCLEAPTP